MTTVIADEVALGVKFFGDDDAPLVLLPGGTTMLSWPDALCERLAAGGRRVARYDLRDSGESRTADPEAPAYSPTRPRGRRCGPCRPARRRVRTSRGDRVGGMVAQVAALDHPGAFSALSLVRTRAVAPGPPVATSYASDRYHIVPWALQLEVRPELSPAAARATDAGSHLAARPRARLG